MSRQLIDREMASNRGFTSYDATRTIIRIMAALSKAGSEDPWKRGLPYPVFLISLTLSERTLS